MARGVAVFTVDQISMLYGLVAFGKTLRDTLDQLQLLFGGQFAKLDS